VFKVCQINWWEKKKELRRGLPKGAGHWERGQNSSKIHSNNNNSKQKGKKCGGEPEKGVRGTLGTQEGAHITK